MPTEPKTNDEPKDAADTVPVERLLAESETRFGHPRHVLAGGIAQAGLSHRVNLSPKDAEAAIKAYLKHEIKPDQPEEE